MVSRSYVSTIHTIPQPYPDVSMNYMYDGSHGISYVHLVISEAASCISCHIPSTDCLTAVYFDRFTHDGSYTSTTFIGVNGTFAAGMPIVA